jgi:hypothetical protein
MTDKQIEEQAQQKAEGLQQALAERGVSSQVYLLRAGECQLLSHGFIIGLIWKGVDQLYCVKDGFELVSGGKSGKTLDMIVGYVKQDRSAPAP